MPRKTLTKATLAERIKGLEYDLQHLRETSAQELEKFTADWDVLYAEAEKGKKKIEALGEKLRQANDYNSKLYNVVQSVNNAVLNVLSFNYDFQEAFQNTKMRTGL